MYPINFHTFRQTPYVLNFIYFGQAYEMYHEFSSIAPTSSVYIQINVGTRITHLVQLDAQVSQQGPLLISMYEGATFTTGNTQPELPPIGLDRRVGNLNNSTTQFFVNPTSVNIASAKLISRNKLYTGGNNSPAISSSSNYERVLSPNTSYIIKIDNLGSQTISATIDLLFYESGN